MSRRDDINILYRPSKILGKAGVFLFCTNIVVSLIAVYVSGDVVSYITTALVVIAFLYMVLSIIDDGIFWYRAESARRKNSVQAAYRIRLDKYETEGYYNNNIDDPELSYAVNQFESIFFTKEICEKMLLGAVVKIVVAVVVLIISCRLIANDDVLLVVAQTVFSTVVIEDSIRLLLFAQRIKSLYDEAYHEFITVGVSKESQLVWLKYFCIEYESLKAHYRVRLSESIFGKENFRLSEEWKALSKQINISVRN